MSMPLEEQTYRDGVQKTLDRIETKVDGVDTKITYTNGKVRKLIIALVLVFGILIGQNFSNAHDIIQLLVSAL